MPGLIYADRVQETTTTTGTGAVTLGGATTGCRAFSTVCVDQQVVAYVISNGTDWEVGRGTYTLSGTTLSRDVVYSSSNSGALVSFSAGSKNVSVDQPAAAICDVALTVAFTMKAVPQ